MELARKLDAHALLPHGKVVVSAVVVVGSPDSLPHIHLNASALYFPSLRHGQAGRTVGPK
jgi:hypothetical protein